MSATAHSFKVGDKAVYVSPWHNEERSGRLLIQSVTRITPLYIYLGSTRYSKDSPNIMPPTREELDFVARKDMQRSEEAAAQEKRRRLPEFIAADYIIGIGDVDRLMKIPLALLTPVVEALKKLDSIPE